MKAGDVHQHRRPGRILRAGEGADAGDTERPEDPSIGCPGPAGRSSDAPGTCSQAMPVIENKQFFSRTIRILFRRGAGLSLTTHARAMLCTAHGSQARERRDDHKEVLARQLKPAGRLASGKRPRDHCRGSTPGYSTRHPCGEA